MRIAVFGGSGYAGGNVTREAAQRGHDVVVVTRSPPAAQLSGVTYRQGSLFDPAFVDEVARDVEVVVVAIRAAEVDGRELVEAVPHLASAAGAHGTRIGIVGAAGSALVAEGGPPLLNTPDFPDAYAPEAAAHAAVLDSLLATPDDVDWFVISPPVRFGAESAAETTGSYRTGGDVLVTDDAGDSELSGVDFAIAVVDEIERPRHHRSRFTVGH